MLNEDTKEYLRAFIRQVITEELNVVFASKLSILRGMVAEEIRREKLESAYNDKQKEEMLVHKLHQEFSNSLDYKLRPLETVVSSIRKNFFVE